MIRINLLPDAKRSVGNQAKSTMQLKGWPLIYGFAALAWMALMGLLYFNTQSSIDERKAGNAQITERIQELKSKSGDLETLREKLKWSENLENVVKDLQSARMGPTRVMRELIKVLSVGGEPTYDPKALEKLREENPLAGFNPAWDVHRLWLKAFEEENRDCKIAGLAKTNDDVAEFLRRLAVSELFENVTLQKTEAQIEEMTKLPVIGFELSCKVKY